MTSPSETPLDLDEIRAKCQKIMDGPWTLSDDIEFTVSAMRDIPALLTEVQRLRDIASDLIVEIGELESRPRTVGDLTARDLGRRVRIAWTDGSLSIIEARHGWKTTYIGLGDSAGWLPLDTPVEFLDDEPAIGHQRPGERFPSHETSEGAQVDPDADERGNASAFRQSSGGAPSWDGIEP